MPPMPSTPWVANLASSANKHEGADDERERGVARGQQVQREQRQQDEHDAHHSGHDRAGMIELRVERQRADGQHQEGDVGIEQEVEDPLPQRHLHARPPSRRQDAA